MRRTACAVVLTIALATGCDGGGPAAGRSTSGPTTAVVVNEVGCLDADPADLPRVDLIDAAVAAVEAHYGGAQRYYEISADRQRVSVVVATETGAAEGSFFCGDRGFAPPEPLGDAEGVTFTADAIDVDTDRVFTGIVDQLGHPRIVDFAIQGAPEGVLYDATVLSDAGGILRVLLTATGEVLAVQAQ